MSYLELSSQGLIDFLQKEGPHLCGATSAPIYPVVPSPPLIPENPCIKQEEHLITLETDRAKLKNEKEFLTRTLEQIQREEKRKVDELQGQLKDEKQNRRILEEAHEKELERVRGELEQLRKDSHLDKKQLGNLDTQNQNLRKQIEAEKTENKRLTEENEGKRILLEAREEMQIEYEQELKTERKKSTDCERRLLERTQKLTGCFEDVIKTEANFSAKENEWKKEQVQWKETIEKQKRMITETEKKGKKAQSDLEKCQQSLKYYQRTSQKPIGSPEEWAALANCQAELEILQRKKEEPPQKGVDLKQPPASTPIEQAQPILSQSQCTKDVKELQRTLDLFHERFKRFRLRLQESQRTVTQADPINEEFRSLLADLDSTTDLFLGNIQGAARKVAFCFSGLHYTV